MIRTTPGGAGPAMFVPEKMPWAVALRPSENWTPEPPRSRPRFDALSGLLATTHQQGEGHALGVDLCRGDPHHSPIVVDEGQLQRHDSRQDILRRSGPWRRLLTRRVRRARRFFGQWVKERDGANRSPRRHANNGSESRAAAPHARSGIFALVVESRPSTLASHRRLPLLPIAGESHSRGRVDRSSGFGSAVASAR